MSPFQLAREVLEAAAAKIAPGVTTDEIDVVVFDEAIKRDCYPSPLGYHGYPKSVCTSVNEVICHGIPDQRPLQDGDILNIGMFESCVHRALEGGTKLHLRAQMLPFTTRDSTVT
jgi:methionine aminopeptidase